MELNGYISITISGKTSDGNLNPKDIDIVETNHPSTLPLDQLQLEAFDFRDGATAGFMHGALIGQKANIEGYNRRIIANDVKILAQLKTRPIDSIITKM